MKRARVTRDYFDDDDEEEDFQMIARSHTSSIPPAGALDDEDPLDAFMRINEKQISEETQTTQALPEIVSINEVEESDSLPPMPVEDANYESEEVQGMHTLHDFIHKLGIGGEAGALEG